MATRTVESRRYDHLYDPINVTSGARDFYKNVQQTMFSSVERVPESRNMFSDNAHYPRHSYRLKPSKELPQHMDGGYVPQQPRGNIPKDLAAEVSGKYRFRYFRRPVVPVLEAVPPEVVVDHGSAAPVPRREDVIADEQFSSDADGETHGDGKRSMGAQTIYRDSQAQTDPYTPEYIVPEGQRPEVLDIKDFTAGGGNFPVGQEEVKLIERRREKRLFEQSLPPITDEASFRVRRAMMEEQELRELAYKEEAIDEEHAARLDKLYEALLRRDKENSFIVDQRIEDLRRRKLLERDRALSQIQRKRIKALRKLGKTRQITETRVDVLTGTGAINIQSGLENMKASQRGRRDIIADYADYSSKVYAPIARQGGTIERPNTELEFEETALHSLPALETLTATAQRHLSVSATPATRRRQGERSTAARKAAATAKDLEAIAAKLSSSAAGGGSGGAEAQLPAWRKPKPRVERPPTPCVEGQSAEDSALENGVILLQRLLRGRAVQNMMFEGKERRMALIRELSHAAEEEEEAASALPSHRSEEDAAAAHSSAAVGAAQGVVLSETLEFLAAELIRRRELAGIAAMASEADNVRRVRDAEEGGRRQAEEALLRREDAVYEQLMRVHGHTAESYVHTVMEGAIDAAAEEDAVLEQQLSAAFVSGSLGKYEAMLDSSQVVVSDLVSSFLLPEVERTRLRQQYEQESKKFRMAAEKEVRQAIENARKQKA